MAHVLFMDLVAYSQSNTDRQSTLVSELHEVVRSVPEFEGLTSAELKEAEVGMAEKLIQALAKPFTFFKGDLTDVDCLEELFGEVQFDQIIHLAARAGVRPSLQEPALYQRVNVEGTVNVLEAARGAGVKKITIASSSLTRIGEFAPTFIVPDAVA